MILVMNDSAPGHPGIPGARRSCSSQNGGWIGDYKGIQMMFAQRGGTTLALACSTPFIVVSCGYVGIGDDGRIFGYG